MTTTLRPTEPLQHRSDGTRARHYQVCVNSRPVGTVHLATSPEFGDTVARLLDLRIEEPDRGRGRGTVAALAAEEVARSWGCERIEASIPDQAREALGLAQVLGYLPRSRSMEKALGTEAPRLPAGTVARPMTESEFRPWLEAGREAYAQLLAAYGVPLAQARAKAARENERLLPEGRSTRSMFFSVLEHRDVRVGTLWLVIQDERAYVLDVEVAEAHRGRGHGRSLMLLAERQAGDAGRTRVGLNVFAGNTPAEGLYASLGYRTTLHHLAKQLL